MEGKEEDEGTILWGNAYLVGFQTQRTTLQGCQQVNARTSSECRERAWSLQGTVQKTIPVFKARTGLPVEGKGLGLGLLSIPGLVFRGKVSSILVHNVKIFTQLETVLGLSQIWEQFQSHLTSRRLHLLLADSSSNTCFSDSFLNPADLCP